MKLIVNERDGCCESIRIEYTPVEALIINQAMRRYVNDEDVHEKDRSIMEQMLDVEPIFVDIGKMGKEKTGYMNREQAVNYLRSSGMSEEQIEAITRAFGG